MITREVTVDLDKLMLLAAIWDKMDKAFIEVLANSLELRRDSRDVVADNSRCQVSREPGLCYCLRDLTVVGPTIGSRGSERESMRNPYYPASSIAL